MIINHDSAMHLLHLHKINEAMSITYLTQPAVPSHPSPAQPLSTSNPPFSCSCPFPLLCLDFPFLYRIFIQIQIILSIQLPTPFYLPYLTYSNSLSASLSIHTYPLSAGGLTSSLFLIPVFFPKYYLLYRLQLPT